MATRRQAIRINGKLAYVRRDKQGRFKEVDMASRSLPVDRRTRAKRTVKSGHGDKGDKRRG